jgi:hypothetical protein
MVGLEDFNKLTTKDTKYTKGEKRSPAVRQMAFEF